jgi:hypothetical protein
MQTLRELLTKYEDAYAEKCATDMNKRYPAETNIDINTPVCGAYIYRYVHTHTLISTHKHMVHL